MKGKYCKEERCSENKGAPCRIADDCFLFKWDINREKRATLRDIVTVDKLHEESKETKRRANSADETAIKKYSCPLEEEEQKDFAEWCDNMGILWAHIPNERKASVSVMVSLSRQGLKKGFPDNFIAVARGKWHGLFIELKRSKKCLSQRTKEQRAWIKSLNAAGYKAVFCYGAEESKKAVLEYLKEEK